ncbi:LEAF RUST 10 DISEASE-RESISTANCE LOCUS RECEPTOR-LIKE PROTEIN KINASE-LIKE 1.2 [Salix purpurea]|uniref:non-specific serine/threonine protein kinase n=1 Tax=Salix purpurea TaxID=77065 RepID=A0A9Q0W3E9_SALPP|nr:LEAF RUST 10 DISEASE-RESISTANCE LOCUS RECEPTOR-LIKE PROTEIN KINASE-LIKE 1.2 [Salix purpurea]
MNFFRSIYNSIFLFTYLASQTASQDPKYKSCEPKSCGAGPNISYPFWLSPEQESLCGHPGFHLTCNNKRPALTISNEVYIINDIFYADNSLLVANAAAFEETCPTPLHNISLDRTPFTISSGYYNFSLLYNCTSKPKNNSSVYALSCATNSTHHSFAGFHLEEIEMNSSYPLNSCQDFVSVPIHTGEDIATSLNRADYSEVLKMGFRMSWTAHNCSACETSGGRCGSENGEFLCFGRDRRRLISGDAGTTLKVVKKVGIGLGASFGTVVIMLVAFFFWYRRKKRQYESIFSRSMKSVPSSKAHMERRSSYNGVHLFSYEELEEATNNFDKTRELGDGGCGTVYYGKLLDGREVAVKRLYDNNYKMLEQFLNEVDILTRLRHQNLVLLHRHEINLSTMAIDKIQNNSLNELVDPSLGFESDYAARKMISAVAGLSFQCLQSAKELRPSMEKVVEILKEIQSRDYNAERAEDKDSSSDGVGLLKTCPIPPSPDTVTVTWNSTSSTPYASV